MMNTLKIRLKPRMRLKWKHSITMVAARKWLILNTTTAIRMTLHRTVNIMKDRFKIACKIRPGASVKRMVIMAAITFVMPAALAQFYPVQVTTQLVPPYSVYLNDYATPGNDKLRLVVLQRDLTKPAYRIRLLLSVELNGKLIMRTSQF